MRIKLMALLTLTGALLVGCSGGDSSSKDGSIGETASNVAADSNSESEAFRPPENTVIQGNK